MWWLNYECAGDSILDVGFIIMQFVIGERVTEVREAGGWFIVLILHSTPLHSTPLGLSVFIGIVQTFNGSYLLSLIIWVLRSSGRLEF